MAAPSVPWELCLDPKPRVYSTDRGVEASASFRIKWDDAFTFYNDVLGLRTATGPDSPIVSTYPWSFPPEPRLYAISCAIEPITVPDRGRGPGLNHGLKPGEFFDLAKADVVFGTRRLGDSTNPTVDDPAHLMQFDPANPLTWCYQDCSFASDTTLLEIGTYKWKSDNSPYSYRKSRRTVLCDLTLRFPQVPYLPFKRIRDFIDTVNSEPCLTCPAGTLLFLGGDTSSELTGAGYRNKSVVLKFRYRKRPWNKSIRPNGTEDYLIDPTGAYQYPEKDQRLIFL